MVFFSWLLIMLINCGLLVGMVMGVLLLLRPVTVWLLTPGQRAFLWGAGWLMAFMPNWVMMYSLISLPFPTFPDLVVPRAENGYPMFLPLVREAGDYYIALPGGGGGAGLDFGRSYFRVGSVGNPLRGGDFCLLHLD